MDPDIQALHDSIHAEYRQALMESQWALANANAQGKAKDTTIADLQALLETATAP